MRNSGLRPVAPHLGVALLMIAVSRIAADPPQAQDLTGIWNSNEGTTYYLRQVGNTLWWAGFNGDPNSPIPVLANQFHRGIISAQVLRGTISGLTVIGDWAEIPRQATATLRDGSIQLQIRGSGTRLHVQSQSGGLRLTDLTRTGKPFQVCADVAGNRDIVCRFDHVLKNTTETLIGTDESLLDNLKPYKDYAVVFGTVAEQVTNQSGFGRTTTCADFYRQKDFGDGDLELDFIADTANLDAQPNFWRTGWINDYHNIMDKLSFLKNRIHTETIMFGRSHKACTPGDPVWLPGWGETNGNGALFQSVPIAGDVQQSGPQTFVRGIPVQPGSRVRITGTIALDCGHGPLSPCFETDNDPTNNDTKNLEMHPVYSIDALQDFTQPRPDAQLTGTWAADDVGTYYVRQIGNVVWWLGLSSDEGIAFTNVFKGYVQAGSPTIQGDWASLPLGLMPPGQGALAVTGSFCPGLSNDQPGCNSSPSPQWNLLRTALSSNPAFGSPPAQVFQWKKLYDRVQAVVHLIVPPRVTLPVISNGGEGTGALVLANNGNVPIRIDSISPSLPQLMVSPKTLTIAASSSASVQLKWLVTGDTTPNRKTTHTATLGVSSSDPLLPFVAVQVQMDVNGGKAQ